MLSVRVEGAADRIRTGTARITTSDAAVTPQPPSRRHRGEAALPLRRHRKRRLGTGTTGLEPAAYRLTSERSPSELRPPRWRGWDSNPRSRAHEAREDSRSSTALQTAVPAKPPPPPCRHRKRRLRSGRQESNLRSPAPEAGGVATLPHDQTKQGTPGGTRTRSFRVEGPASSPVRPRGRESSGGRARTCASRLTVARLSLSTTPERAEAHASRGGRGGSRTPKAAKPTRFRDGVPHPWQPFRVSGSGRTRTCTTPIKSRRLFLLSYEARGVTGRDRTCAASRFRRALYR
jgi:hypothetical protein